MAQGKIRIRLKGYDHQQLDRSAQQIVDTAQRSGATITGPVPLPTEKNVYCVIRSPFKDKDSREHFEVRTHKRLIDILSPTPKTIDQLMRLDLARPASTSRSSSNAMAKGILGRKLGMTQVFDPETGAVTSVTVIAAGPCPVVQVKTVGRDGYDAVQLAFDAVAERKLTRPELGHLKRFSVGAAPQARRVPRRDRRRGRGRDRDGRDLPAGRRGQGRRDRDRQGLPGHDQAPQLLERPALARLAQHPQAGLDRRLGDAVARLQGHQDGRPHGRQARHAARADRARGRRRAEPPARQGLGSRPEERARRGARADGCPKAPLLDAAGAKAKDVSLEEGVFAAEVKPHLVHEAVRSEQNAHRAGTFATKSRGLVSGGRAKPWRQKGTGRARQGTIRAPQFEGGGHAFAKVPRTFVQKVNRKAAKAALRSALASHAQAGSLALVDATRVRRAVDEGREGLPRGRRPRRAGRRRARRTRRRTRRSRSATSSAS